MFKFYDIEKDIVLEPSLEFETQLKLNPIDIIKTSSTFCIAIGSEFADLWLYDADKPLIYRLTGEFKFKIDQTPKGSRVGLQTEYKILKFYSADNSYFQNLKLLLSLEPCFKIQPSGVDSQTIKNLILNSNCKHGFLEISQFSKLLFEEIIIYPGLLEKIEIIPDESINRIQIYDIEKNQCRLPDTNLTPSYKNEKSEPLQTQLFKLIYDYLEKNVSSTFARDLPLDRDAIFREHATPETLEKTFSAIKKAIEKIKLNQKEHKEKIKELISIFYSENYNELEKLNLTTTIEKLYAQL